MSNVSKQIGGSWCAVLAACALALPVLVLAHGDLAPQPVDTKGLDPLGDEWRTSNPYRGNETAIKIGKTAYAMQCARCHGINGVSGGLAPDLRFLDKGEGGDKDFITPTRKGVFRDGRTLMPKYEGILSQEAMWALRSYIETIHED